MADRQFAASDDWALASDGIQWILLRHRTRRSVGFWNPASFVRSTCDILAGCRREKGVPTQDAQRLLEGLPSTFNEWVSTARRSVDGALDAPAATTHTALATPVAGRAGAIRQGAAHA